ncbi:MAG: alpha-amylase [Phycisphaeraceae bacterium]|nr:MAG: alpha-amylase [Phycisphaeraceae bacterium]
MRTTLIASTLAAALSAAPANADEPHWAADSVFYLAFVRSYADSAQGPLANDGVGDLRGMIERLDYLNDGDPETDTDLGVTGLWLMPIAQSPSYHGYDTTDYEAVDDEYGTMDDLRELVDACHARGIRVVLDLVLNHTADEHPWFVDSAQPGSGRRDWYIWRDPKPAYKGAWGQTVWHDHQRERAGASYFGGFHHGMPDLNYETPAVTAEMQRIARFWIDEAGVDGFRLDAVKHLIEDGEDQSSTDATIAWLRGFNGFCDSVRADAWLVGEVWSGPDEIAKYIGADLTTPALDSCFDFPVAYAILEGIRDGDGARISAELARSWELHRGRSSPFLSNHDTERAMSVLGKDERRARAAATLLLTAPGTPFIYYGEEIGMTGTKPDPNLRTPMQWTWHPVTRGFSTVRPWHPVQEDAASVNVETERRDPISLWQHYRTLIAARQDMPALRRGSFTPVDAGAAGAVAFVREQATGTRRVLVIVNATDDDINSYTIDAEQLGLAPGAAGRDVLSGAETAPVPAEDPRAWRPFAAALDPYESRVIDLGTP